MGTCFLQWLAEVSGPERVRQRRDACHDGGVKSGIPFFGGKRFFESYGRGSGVSGAERGSKEKTRRLPRWRC